MNKRYIITLEEKGLMQDSGRSIIAIAKKNGAWSAMDDVENLVIPEDLKIQFKKNKVALKNYENFAPSYRKSYLSWLNQAKRAETRQKRIIEIIKLCNGNQKSRI